MRGTILGVHDGRGVLIGPNEQRVEFPIAEWRSAGAPVAGQVVDYIESEGRAHSVFAVPNASIPAPATSPSVMLGAFSVGALALGFIVPLLPTIAAFVLGLLGASRARQDGDETGLVLSRIGWIGSLIFLVLGTLILVGVMVLLGGIFALSEFSLGPGDWR